MKDEHWGAKRTPEIDLANRTFAVAYAVTSVTSAWALPLFDRAFDREPELRNKLFCLLVCGILDSGWEYRSRLNGLKNDAKKIGSLSCPFYLDMFEKYLALGVDLLEIFSRDDMIVITELRNQWLHGHWTEVHKEDRTIYYAEKGQIKRARIPATEFNKAFSRIATSVDSELMPLRKRFCERKTFFWAVDRALSAPPLREHVMSDLVLHSKFVSPKVVLVIPDPSYRPTTPKDAYASLLELGLMMQRSDK
jgi:hypothetical protein